MGPFCIPYKRHTTRDRKIDHNFDNLPYDGSIDRW